MAVRFKPFIVPLWCIGIGAFGLLLASSIFDKRSEAESRLRDWRKADAKVSLMQELGAERKTLRAMVAFHSADGKSHEGYLFGETHEPGEALAIYYDPQNLYMPKGINVRAQVFTPQQLVAAADLEKRWLGIALLVGGLGLIAFGGFRAYRASVSPSGTFSFGALFGSSIERRDRPGQLLYPSAKERLIIEQLPSHDGVKRLASREFRIPPPPEIGPVVSAESSILIDGPKPLFVRLAVGFLFAALIVAAMTWLATLGDDRSNELTVRYLGFGIAVAIFLAHARTIRYAAESTYVGEHGLARCTVKGSNANATVEIVSFDRASKLFADQTETHVYGVYRGTVFNFAWTDRDSQIVWSIKGLYQKGKPSAEGDAWRFAQAAERAWLSYNARRDQAT